MVEAMGGTCPSPEEIHDAVEADEKDRFELGGDSPEDGGQAVVRAVQGHSVELPDPQHDPITTPEEVPLLLHAASEER